MSNCKSLTFYRQAGGGPSTERHSSFENKIAKMFHFDSFSKLILKFKSHCKYNKYTGKWQMMYSRHSNTKGTSDKQLK